MKRIRKWFALRLAEWRIEQKYRGWVPGSNEDALRAADLKHARRSIGGRFKTYKGRHARVSAS